MHSEDEKWFFKLYFIILAEVLVLLGVFGFLFAAFKWELWPWIAGLYPLFLAEIIAVILISKDRSTPWKIFYTILHLLFLSVYFWIISSIFSKNYNDQTTLVWNILLTGVVWLEIALMAIYCFYDVGTKILFSIISIGFAAAPEYFLIMSKIDTGYTSLGDAILNVGLSIINIVAFSLFMLVIYLVWRNKRWKKDEQKDEQQPLPVQTV